MLRCRLAKEYLCCSSVINYLFLFVSLVSFAQLLSAQTHNHDSSSSMVLDQARALELSQSAIGNTVADYKFINQDNKPVSLSSFMGKPSVISFIYTSCYHTCPMMTSHLKKAVEIAAEAVGPGKFNVISIGFDTAMDTPERMRMFAAQRGIDFESWNFLSGDDGTMTGISKDLGFSFAPSPKGFDHLAQTTIIDAQGKVYRQIYGATFETPLLAEPLKELVFGKHTDAGVIDQWLNGIKLFCTIYDPSTNRYYFDYSIFFMIAIGLLCLGSIAAFVIKSWQQK